MMFNELIKKIKSLFLFLIFICSVSLLFINTGCEKHRLSGGSRSLSGDSTTMDSGDEETEDDDGTTEEDDDDGTGIAADDDDSNSNTKSTGSKSNGSTTDSSISADDDDDNITENTYTVKNLVFEPASITVNRVEHDCLKGKCSADVTLSIYSIGGTKVSDEVAEKSKTRVTLSKPNQVSGDYSHLCPNVPNKNVVLELSIYYGGQTLDASNRSILLGARVDSQTLMMGLADVADPYNFHNMDTIISTIRCPNVKKLTIRKLCEDTVLDDAVLRQCWITEGTSSSCPKNNKYKNSDYVVSCRQ